MKKFTFLLILPLFLVLFFSGCACPKKEVAPAPVVEVAPAPVVVEPAPEPAPAPAAVEPMEEKG